MKNKYIILLAALLINLLMGFLSSNRVYAANPGCYARSGSSDSIVINPYECPTTEYTNLVNNGQCVVFSAGSSGVSNTGTTVDCSTITVGSTPISSSGVGSDGIGRDELAEDCTGELDAQNCGIIRLVVTVINLLSVLAVLAIITSIVIAGYQYMTAQDNSGKIQQARQRIIWAISALFLFIFMYALLNFLVPGGVL